MCSLFRTAVEVSSDPNDREPVNHVNTSRKCRCECRNMYGEPMDRRPPAPRTDGRVAPGRAQKRRQGVPPTRRRARAGTDRASAPGPAARTGVPLTPARRRAEPVPGTGTADLPVEAGARPAGRTAQTWRAPPRSGRERRRTRSRMRALLDPIKETAGHRPRRNSRYRQSDLPATRTQAHRPPREHSPLPGWPTRRAGRNHFGVRGTARRPDRAAGRTKASGEASGHPPWTQLHGVGRRRHRRRNSTPGMSKVSERRQKVFLCGALTMHRQCLNHSCRETGHSSTLRTTRRQELMLSGRGSAPCAVRLPVRPPVHPSAAQERTT